MPPVLLSLNEVEMVKTVYPMLGRQGTAALLCRPVRVIRQVARDYRLRREPLSDTYIDRQGRRWQFRSTWETAAARWLDARRRDWDYERCSFRVLMGGACTPYWASYTPDFWVLRPDGSVELLIDVKGRRFQGQMMRIHAFQRQHPQPPLELWGQGAPALKALAL